MHGSHLTTTLTGNPSQPAGSTILPAGSLGQKGTMVGSRRTGSVVGPSAGAAALQGR